MACPTALSTTITAIVCYVFFGYIYQRLPMPRTNLISGIEQVTTTFLMPKFQCRPTACCTNSPA